MSITGQTTDVVPYGHYDLHREHRHDLGELPNAISALEGLGMAVSAKSKSKLYMVLMLDESGRFGVAWEDADVDCAPFVRRGTISVTAENGATLFHVVIKMQPFPPSDAGIVLGTRPPCRLYSECERFRVTRYFRYHRSGYYGSLLRGNFSESTVHTKNGTEVAESSQDTIPRLFEDSDDETDEYVEGQMKPRTPSSSPSVLPHKRVVVTDTAFTTYQATLVWMCSRYIRFAPLRSSKDRPSTVSKSRLQAIRKMIEANLRTSLPASPKSVYRLSHLLELSDLQEIALDHLSSQITVHNAATELFSDVASAYPALRDVVLDFVVKHWSEVRTSDSYREIKERADADGLPTAAAHTALLLSERMKAP